MLRFILGVSGTGKTTHLLAQMRQRAQQGLPSIYLVPEQFSSSAEILLYKTLGDKGSGMVEVVSFRTMAERILKLGGGLSVPLLSEAARTVFVRRALDALEGEAGSFARHRRNHAFCNMCAATIEELKTAGATPAALRSIGLQNSEPKLAELALIFEAYEAAIEGIAMDPEDRLTQAATKADCGYFDGKACFIDNFDGFTPPEYTLLAPLVELCEEVEVALCCDGISETDGGLGLFSPVRRTAHKLMQLAQKSGTQVVQQQLTRQWRAGAAGLAGLAALLAFGQAAGQQEPCDTTGLTITCYNSDWEEARAVAAAMHSLALQGVPYSRMAVVCRDLSLYETAVRRAFGLFHIPYFTDAPTTIEYTAPVVFIRAALRLLREGLTSDAILALLKTGLCGFAAAQLAALENYVYTWRPKAADWHLPFTNNPGGLMQRFGKAQQQQLALAENTRLATVPLLEDFIRLCRGKTAAVVSKQLYLLLQKFNAPTHAEAIENELAQKETQSAADERRRAWDVAMELLEQMEMLVGKEQLPPAEYDDLFLLLVRSTDFGQLPQALECAIFTSADRMRLASPEVCFVLGVTEGEFPMQVGYSGLLTHADRDLLVSGGIEMPGSFENRTLLEEMFFYRALTSAKNQLHISWPARHGGTPKAVSAALKPACRVLCPPPLALAEAAGAATPAAAFDLLGGLYRENTPQAASLYGALAGTPQGEGWLTLLSQVQNSGEFKVRETGLIRRIVGDTLTLSATKTERYYQCRFSYYMERILGVMPRRRAELSPMESGTFVHYVLEQVLAEAGEEFAKLADAPLAELAGQYADAFIAENLPGVGIREQNILQRVKETTIQLLLFLRDSAAQSEFVVDAVELPIGEGEGAIPPLEIKTPEGQTLRVTGEVDRVDVLRQGDKTYLCIMDYKTGSKKFNLADVYCGLNMQMMIYMDTLRKNGGSRYPGALPAAVLYVGADPAPETGPRSQSGPVYQVDGLLLDDAAILKAMDKEGSGLFLPVKYDKNGKPKTSKKLAGFAKIGEIERHVETLLAGMAGGVYSGVFPARPLVETNRRPCDYCPYRMACRHENGMNEEKIAAPKDAFEPKEVPEDG